MKSFNRLAAGASAFVLLVMAACTDSPVAPGPTPPIDGRPDAITCQVTVATKQMSCVRHTASGGPSREILGGQNLYVLLASSGTSYDGGTQILQSSVTVQNLTADSIGTPDGVSVTGMRVFFTSGPSVTSGTGSVTVLTDSIGTFTESGQKYFVYNQALAPYEISAAQQWQFQITGSVETFAFTVAVDAARPDEDAALFNALWDGSEDTDWHNVLNWAAGVVPSDTSAVRIPAGLSNYPVLTANAQARHIRVDLGATLDLASFELQVGGNVDGVGPISGGTIRMTGAGLLGGNVASLVITGGVSLQKGATATGAVSVSDGSLTIADQAFSISVP